MTDSPRHPHHPSEAERREHESGHQEHGVGGHDHADHGHDHAGDHGSGHDHADHGHDHAGDHGSGHDHSAHAEQFRRLFWIMLVLAVPTVVLAPMFARLVGYPVPESGWLTWVAPVLGTVMYVWGGRPFLAGAIDEVRARRPGMMLLIGLAITVALLSSWGSTLGVLSADLDFWWELALLVVIMLLGHWVEMRSTAQTASALTALAALLPDTAEVVRDGETVQVDPSELLVRDLVVVRPGASVPADGRVVEGSASMDESMVTGESTTVRRAEGDPVIAGTIATDSGLRVEVTAVGDDTTLAGISRLVEEAQSSSSRAQRLADRAAAWLFWFAFVAAILTAIVWGLLGAPDDAVVRTITVLVIACPHALGLAIPLVVSIATERAARAGVLVTDRLALESMRRVEVVLFDKTGTLTRGEPAVSDVVAAAGSADVPKAAAEAGVGNQQNDPADRLRREQSSASDAGEDRVLRLAAAAEADSEHPLARAIVRAAEQRELALPRAADFSSHPAEGVSARVEGTEVHVGGPHLLTRLGGAPLAETAPWREAGATVLHVFADGEIVGALRVEDEVRPESKATIEALHARGVEVAMITGDAESVARTVAVELGIDRVFADVRPEDKAAAVARLQQEGRITAMVGDGVNDAPALARADVGLAIGAGTDVAIGSAGVVLAGSDPRSVLSVIDLSWATYRKMVQNLWWAAGYNLLSVPLAAGVLAPVGFVLPMSVGAILMSLSTVVVALNAQLLRRLDLQPERIGACD
ncbi:HAD-IC family P-type ATPase [Brevibacterium jeotgali]|uniref:Cu2+-exporting ATPase n=1 Tax=Brevibacterium jeotgali TaxID=1262550 RepID=A0A2H1L486_9MICO|nr:HAD-IC family P-type ATPase [Brevibacterium jeotgali]TWC02431.1 Cu2+-exporting ATPase [Brevibacterium jeotgali]SMY11223.1 Cu2+-exporting ATPase [Brevibacterium jeotgali]